MLREIAHQWLEIPIAVECTLGCGFVAVLALADLAVCLCLFCLVAMAVCVVVVLGFGVCGLRAGSVCRGCRFWRVVGGATMACTRLHLLP